MRTTRLNTLAACALLGLMAAGCGSSGGAPMSNQERASFRGGPAAPRTAAQDAAIKDFQQNFKRLHPDQGQGQPPASGG